MKRHTFLKGALTGALIVLLAAGLASCGLLKSEESRKMELLESLIDRYYIGEADAEDLTEGVYKGYIEGLGDPYSAYYDEEETARMTESLSGEFGGVGALMSQDRETGVITVLQVYEDNDPDGFIADEERRALDNFAAEDQFGRRFSPVAPFGYHIKGIFPADSGIDAACQRDGIGVIVYRSLPSGGDIPDRDLPVLAVRE